MPLFLFPRLDAALFIPGPWTGHKAAARGRKPEPKEEAGGADADDTVEETAEADDDAPADYGDEDENEDGPS